MDKERQVASPQTRQGLQDYGARPGPFFERRYQTYSGGKDSTATTVLTLEWWKRKGKPVEIHVVYADTGLEIPTLHAQALAFLEAVKRLHPGVHVHTARPRPEESFWVQIIGKGYPPPHNRFRWCTRRLKIAPMDRLVQSLPGKKAILTGVRFGESDAQDQVRRDKAMARALENGHAHLLPLYEFREWLWAWTRDPRTREKRKDGKPGRLTLEARREVYRRLKEVEAKLGMEFLTSEEEAFLRDRMEES